MVLAGALGCWAVGPVEAQNGNLLVNGGFETGNATGWVNGSSILVGANGSQPAASELAGYSNADKDAISVWASEGTFAAYEGSGRVEPGDDEATNGRLIRFRQDLASDNRPLPGARYEAGFSVAFGLEEFSDTFANPGEVVRPQGAVEINYNGSNTPLFANGSRFDPFEVDSQGRPPRFEVPQNDPDGGFFSPLTFETARFRIPPSADTQDFAFSFISFDFTSYGSGPVSFDDFYLRRADSLAGEVVNGQFTTGGLERFSQSTDGAGVAQAVDLGDGDFAAQLTTGSQIVLTQDSVVTDDRDFEVAFDYQYQQTAGTLTVLLDGIEIGRVEAPASLSDGLTRQTFKVTDPALQGLGDTTLSFAFDDDLAGRSIFIDNIAITLIPEPATAALLGLAGLALAGRRRRA